MCTVCLFIADSGVVWNPGDCRQDGRAYLQHGPHLGLPVSFMQLATRNATSLLSQPQINMTLSSRKCVFM